MPNLTTHSNKPAFHLFFRPVDNQKGSVILVAIMLLALMTIIAISASKTAVVESMIIRNTAIHKQNISLAEAAALQLAQDALINIADPANPHLAESSPVREPYIITDTLWESSGKKDDWYDFGPTVTGRVLSDPNSSGFPQWIEPTLSTEMDLIDDVRKDTNAPLRVALVGWESAPGSSLKGTKATRKRARVLAEYMSDDYGMTRLELGIEREF
jgi:hypothetical protein